MKARKQSKLMSLNELDICGKLLDSRTSFEKSKQSTAQSFLALQPFKTKLRIDLVKFLEKRTVPNPVQSTLKAPNHTNDPARTRTAVQQPLRYR